MPKSIPSYLRLHMEEEPASLAPEPCREFLPLCESFEQATGWKLELLPPDAELLEQYTANALWSGTIQAGPERAGGQLVLLPGKRESAQRRLTSDLVIPFTQSLADLLSRLEQTRTALWKREAELATAIPLAPHREEEDHLALRLEAILRGGAGAIGCCAAGIYLLDDATSELKLRASWGLPADRLTEPPRPLRGAVADLEALTGHAVALENAALLPNWQMPEEFASAVCVPISTPTFPLGTLWFFGATPRDFSDHETGLTEIVAGRIAAELEREILLAAGSQSRQDQKQLAAAARAQDHQLPQIAPLVDGWKVAGWTARQGEIGGGFYDWYMLGDGTLGVTVGATEGAGLDAAMAATVLQTALKSHSHYRHDARQMLLRVNHTLWTSSAGDWFAKLLYGVIQPDSGQIDLATAGQLDALLLRNGEATPLAMPSLPLGSEPQTEYKSIKQQLLPADLLLVSSEPLLQFTRDDGKPLTGRDVAAALNEVASLPTEEILQRFRDLLAEYGGREATRDLHLLAIQRQS